MDIRVTVYKWLLKLWKWAKSWRKEERPRSRERAPTKEYSHWEMNKGEAMIMQNGPRVPNLVDFK